MPEIFNLLKNKNMNTVAVKTIWTIDPAHSEIQFKVRHMMVSTVTGAFTSFTGSLETEEEDFSDAVIEFTAEVDSISTNNAQRDAHLKSDDFFNAAQFPQLRFRSTSFKSLGGDRYQLKGDLTIRDITLPLTLNVEYFGSATDPYGNTKAGFELNGAISRKDFGLKWNAVTEAGSVVVSDEVKLHLNVQLVKN